MTKIFHGYNQFLRSTKMKLVHSLGDMDEVLDLELNEHVDILNEYLTLRNILRSFKVKVIPVILSVEKTNTLVTYHFLYEETMDKYMVDLLSNLDSHIKDIGYWEESDGHYIDNILEQVTPDDVMCNAENSGFWEKYAATINSGTTAPLPGADANLNNPPLPEDGLERSSVIVPWSRKNQAQKQTKSKHGCYNGCFNNQWYNRNRSSL
jgi:hypothetical protein